MLQTLQLLRQVLLDHRLYRVVRKWRGGGIHCMLHSRQTDRANMLQTHVGLTVARWQETGPNSTRQKVSSAMTFSVLRV